MRKRDHDPLSRPELVGRWGRVTKCNRAPETTETPLHDTEERRGEEGNRRSRTSYSFEVIILSVTVRPLTQMDLDLTFDRPPFWMIDLSLLPRISRTILCCNVMSFNTRYERHPKVSFSRVVESQVYEYSSSRSRSRARRFCMQCQVLSVYNGHHVREKLSVASEVHYANELNLHCMELRSRKHYEVWSYTEEGVCNAGRYTRAGKTSSKPGFVNPNISNKLVTKGTAADNQEKRMGVQT